MSASDVLQEVKDYKQFLMSRKKTASEEQAQSLQTKLASSIVDMISKLPSLTAKEARLLSDEVSDKSFGEDGTSKMTTMIDSKLHERVSAAKNQANTMGKAQLVETPWRYFTESEWEFFNDKKKSVSAKMTKAIERLSLLGVRNYDENTYKWLLAVILVSHYEELPCARDIHCKLQDLKQVRTVEKKAFPHEWIVTYPETPADLPAHIYNWAYSDEGPANRDMIGIKAIGKKIPLRKNSLLLKECKVKSGSVEDSQFAYARTAAVKVTSQPAIKLEPLKSEREASPDTEDSDVELAALRAQYLADVAKLKVKRRSSSSAHHALAQGLQGIADAKKEKVKEEKVKEEPVDPVMDGIVLKVEADGSLHLQALGDGPSPDHGADPPHVCKTPVAAAASKPGEITFEELDDYSKAAIAALDKRNTKKAADAKEKKAAAKAAKKAADSDDPLLKRPAAAGGAVKKVKTGATAKLEAVEVDSSKIMAAMPSGNSGKVAPVAYKGGIIYTTFAKRTFRALRDRGDDYSETSKAWGSKRTQKEAWAEAVAAIDEHHKRKKSKTTSGKKK